jgi:hypothetical protein
LTASSIIKLLDCCVNGRSIFMKYFRIIALFLAMALGSPAFAGTTTIDLFRSGNTITPKMDNVRTPTTNPTNFDIQTTTIGGVEYVTTGNGGISTFDLASKCSPTVWKLPKGSTYPSTLTLVDDKSGNHWSWRPTSQMTLAAFQSALASLNASFVKN